MSQKIDKERTQAQDPQMSLRAWVFVWAVLGLTITLIILAALQTPHGRPDWIVFAVLVSLATATHFFEAQFERQTYSPHLVFFFAGVILLPPLLFVLLASLPHLLEWGYKRLTNSVFLRQWYIQPFNIGTHIIAGLSAQHFFTLLYGNPPLPAMPPEIAAGAAAAVLYLLINHYLIGQTLVLARSVSWHESAIWNAGNLLPDLVLLMVGYLVAALWSLSPWLIIPALLPLSLVYRALKVPQLEKEARTDQKTGLLNARRFQELYEEELRRAHRFQRPLSVVMADLDLLRDINNNYGHISGDVVLAGVAEIIKANIREYDIAARFGGEEFAIVLSETDPTDATILSNRLRHIIETTPFYASGNDTPIHATMSFGIATSTAADDVDEAAILLHQADVALYQAKFRGRNQVVHALNVPHSFKLEYNGENATGAEQIEAGIPATATTTLQGESMAGLAVIDSPSTTDHAGPTNLRDGRSGEKRSSQSHPPISRAGTDNDKSSRYHRLFVPFIGTVIGVGVLVALFSLFDSSIQNVQALALFGLLAIIAETLEVQVYRKATVSGSATITLAALLVLGLPGVLVTSTAISLWHYSRRRPLFYRLFFNWASHMAAGAAAAAIFSPISLALDISNLLIWGLFALVASLIYYLIETGLIAIAIALQARENVRHTWNEQFRWLAQHYAVMGVIGLFVAIAYLTMGLWGVIGFVLPILLIHQSQKMYVERTETSVAELRRMNGELQAANREIAHASAEIGQLNEELMEMLAKIIDARDPQTSGHAIKVSEYAVSIAMRLHLPPAQVEDIRKGALLHDIGKLGIPEKILNKPGSLTAEEYRIVQGHAALGAELLKTVRGLRQAAPIAHYHHERWDGTGYPDGLKSTEIPIAARILTVCDSAEAMAACRPYKEAYSNAQIIAELRRCAGTQFDPTVAEIFIAVMEDEMKRQEIAAPQKEQRAEEVFVFGNTPQLLGQTT